MIELKEPVALLILMGSKYFEATLAMLRSQFERSESSTRS